MNKVNIRAIEARNKRYNKASDDDKRVMLAKEVLRLLKMGAVKPLRGYYIVKDNRVAGDLSRDARTAINDGTLVCEVCAKGALFVAACSIQNGLPVRDLNNDNMQPLIFDGACSRLDEDMFDLYKLFAPISWSIENTFEDSEVKAEARMKSIMNIVIEEKGIVENIKEKLEKL